MSQIQRAKLIQKSLGTRAAAGYLRNKGYFLETAIRILARKA
jgi:hypothetical protein